MADLDALLVAHVGHWIWNLLYLAPILVLAAALIVAQVMDRRNPGKYDREAEEEAGRELDEILRP